jgi:hypothetical protein
VLRFGSTGDALPFLSEHEVPKVHGGALGGDAESGLGGVGGLGSAPGEERFGRVGNGGVVGFPAQQFALGWTSESVL